MHPLRALLQRNDETGLYTIEASMALIVFTVCFMILISLVSVIKTELIIQGALNDVAIELSEASYAIGCTSENAEKSPDAYRDIDEVVYAIDSIRSSDSASDFINLGKNLFSSIEVLLGSNNRKTQLTGLLLQVFRDTSRETTGRIIGGNLAKMLTYEKLDSTTEDLDRWLLDQGVEGGYSGFDFSLSRVLNDGKSVEVTAVYKIKINSYGLLSKNLDICQRAATKAWLPINADDLTNTDQEDSLKNIWKQTNFVRGKYFVRLKKSEEEKNGVKSGQGVDLYYPESGKYVEIYSLNPFSSTYSSKKAETESYIINENAVIRQLSDYCVDFKKDIASLKDYVIMDDGSSIRKVGNQELTMVLVLPEEVAEMQNFQDTFKKMEEKMRSEDKIILEKSYIGEALGD